MKANAFLNSFLLLVLICFLQNCTLQKRIYQKGYYVSFKKNKTIPKSTIEIVSDINSNDLLASNNNDLSNIFTKKTHPADSCGDLLIFNDSTRLAVKVVEINEQQVKYKRCDNFNGPQFSVYKNKVATIIYSNGVKEVLTKRSVGCKDSLILINGNKMLVAVTEVTSEFVKYKSCNDLKGPERELSLSNIGKIRYSDGRVTKYNEVVITPPEQETKASKIVRIILGGILIGLGIAIIIGLFTLGSTANALFALYILFILFSILFTIAMGWHQNLPFNPWFF